MAVSPQRLTIYLYSAHRAVIFAIAQLSCLLLLIHYAIVVVVTVFICTQLFGYSAVSHITYRPTVLAGT